MKAKILLVAVLVALSTLGSSCIRKGFLIPINLTVDQCYPVSPAPSGNFSVPDNTVYLGPLLDESFRRNIKAVRFYDIKISTRGNYAGTVRCTLYVNGQRLLSVGGPPNNGTPVAWSALATPQSLLGSSPYVGADAGGVTVLVSALNRLIVDDNASLVLSAQGTITGSNFPAGSTVCVQVLAQADAELNASGDNGGPVD